MCIVLSRSSIIGSSIVLILLIRIFLDNFVGLKIINNSVYARLLEGSFTLTLLLGRGDHRHSLYIPEIVDFRQAIKYTIFATAILWQKWPNFFATFTIYQLSGKSGEKLLPFSPSINCADGEEFGFPHYLMTALINDEYFIITWRYMTNNDSTNQ